MDKEDRYAVKNFIARRGGAKERKFTGHKVFQKKKRKLIPRYAKFGGGRFGESPFPLDFVFYDTAPRRQSHEKERSLDTQGKNFRRSINTNRNRRKYWKPQRDKL